ncbi:MAG: Enoyl-[acyl-carrier protein] reductase, partial [Pseudonocardia sp.]|nr:Enoyl-[acyl-carrier protein] reductase [Pseudonocardia sp.]
SGIHELVSIAEFIPRMAAEAADILRRLAGVGQPVH